MDNLVLLEIGLLTTAVEQKIFELRREHEMGEIPFYSQDQLEELDPDIKALVQKLHFLVLTRFHALYPEVSFERQLKDNKLLVPVEMSRLLADTVQKVKGQSSEIWDKFIEMPEQTSRENSETIRKIRQIKQEANNQNVGEVCLEIWKYYENTNVKVRQEVLLTLIDMLEGDDLSEDNGQMLFKFVEEVADEVVVNRANNNIARLQCLLIRTLGIATRCALLHQAKRDVTAFSEQTKTEVQNKIKQFKDSHIIDHPEIAFWINYANEGAVRLESDMSDFMRILRQLGLLGRAVFMVGTMIKNPENVGVSGAQALADFTEVINGIHWKKKWFEKLFYLEEKCRKALNDPQAFRLISSTVKQNRHDKEDSDFIYGVLEIIENTAKRTENSVVEQECLKTIVHFLTAKNHIIKERVVISLYRLMGSSSPYLRETCFTVIYVLQLLGYISNNQKVEKREIERKYVYINILKYLLRYLTNIKPNYDIGGVSLITMLCTSEDEKLVIKMLNSLKELYPGFDLRDSTGRNPFHLLIRDGHVSMLEHVRDVLQLDLDAQDDVSGSTPLHEAVNVLSVAGAETMVRLQANPDIPNHEGNTPIHLAVSRSGTFLALLIKEGTPVNRMNHKGKTALNLAVEYDNPKIVEMLLKLNGEITQEKAGVSLLLFAAKKEAARCMQYLIESKKGEVSSREAEEILRFVRKLEQEGVNDHPFLAFHTEMIKNTPTYAEMIGRGKLLVDTEGRTALHNAIINGSVEEIDVELLEIGDKQGNKPLHLAAGLKRLDLVNRLLDAGADPNSINDFGETPFLLCSGSYPCRFPHKVDEANGEVTVQILNRFKSAEVNVNAQDLMGNHALHRAMLYAPVEAISWLIENCPDAFYLKNAFSQIPVELAYKKNRTLNLGHLWEKDLSECNELIKSSTDGRLQLSHVMIFGGFSKQYAMTKDNSRFLRTGFHWAAEMGRLDYLQAWKDANLDMDLPDELENTAAHLAAENGNVEFLRSFRELGGKVNTKNHDGYTPLHLAAIHQHLDVVRLLGDDRELLLVADNHGNTPLHHACHTGDPEMVEALYTDQIPGNDEGNTPLHEAAYHGQVNAVRFLCSRGEPMDAVNRFGQTPFILASMKGHDCVVKFLLAETVSIDDVDEDGNTALHEAVRYFHYEIICLLVAADEKRIIEKKGRLVHKKNYKGQIPLHFLALTPPSLGVRVAERIFEVLSKAGSSLMKKDKKGERLVHLLAQNGRINLLRSVVKVDKKRMLTIRDRAQNTVLHHAALGNKYNSVKEICDHKVDFDAENNEGMTPLLLAASKKSWRVLCLLIYKGADPFKTNKQGQSLLHLILDTPELDAPGLTFLKKVIHAFPKLLLILDAQNRSVLHLIAKRGLKNALPIFTLFPGNRTDKEAFILQVDTDGNKAEKLAVDEKQRETPIAKEIRGLTIDYLGSEYKNRKKIDWTKHEEF